MRKHNPHHSTLADEIWRQTATFPDSSMRYLIHLYPAMNKHPQYFLFTVALIRKRFPTDENGYPIVSCKRLAKMVDRSEKHFNAQQFLDRYKAAIDPDLLYTDYHHDKGIARVLIQTGTEGIVHKLYNLVESKKRVFVNTQETVTAKKKQERINTMLTHLKQQSHGLHPLQTQLMAYLHNRPYSFYAKRVEENAPLAMQRYPKYREQVTSLLDFALPYYSLSNKMPFTQCPRLFGHGLPLLPKRVRTILLPDCQEIDICNAHLFLAVSLAQCGYDLYQQMGNMWQYLYRLYSSYGVTDQIKPLLKKVCCSLIYGMSATDAKRQFIHGFYSKSKGYADKKLRLHAFFDKTTSQAIADHFFSEQNLVFKLLQTVNTALQERYHQSFSLPDNGFSQESLQRLEHQKLYSFLSSGLQSWELFLIGKAYEYAEKLRKDKKQSFDIVVHSHDGVTIWTKASNIRDLGIEEYLQTCYQRCFPDSPLKLTLSYE